MTGQRLALLSVASALGVFSLLGVVPAPTPAPTAPTPAPTVAPTHAPPAASTPAPLVARTPVPVPPSVAPAVGGVAPLPALAPGGAIFLVTSSASTVTGPQNSALSYAVTSLTAVANAFHISVVQVGTQYDPKNPTGACSTDNGKVDPGHDVLLVLSLGESSQSTNSYTGILTQDAQLNLTQIYCDRPDSKNLQDVWGESTRGTYHDNYIANPLSGVSSVVAGLKSPWINKYRTWLVLPIAFIDSFRHDQAALNGAIYCGTAQATVQMLMDQQMIELRNVVPAQGNAHAYIVSPGGDLGGSQLWAFRENVNGTWLRVAGVNECKRPQPVSPAAGSQMIWNSSDLTIASSQQQEGGGH
jgi:hypothetical protein